MDDSNSLINLANKLVTETSSLARNSNSEEDLKVGFEKILEPILKELGINVNPRYEKTIFKAGRSDALHGQVVIEYEPPYAFKSKNAINHAYDQLVGYIQGLSNTEKETLFIFDAKFIGVGFDGNKIFFVRYQGDSKLAKTELTKEDFKLLGPYEFTVDSARTFLTHLRALSRLPLTAENLAQKFGPHSDLAPKAVSAFADALENWGDQTRIRTFFNEWRRLFGIVYGEQFSGHGAEESEVLSMLYKVRQETDFQELLFSVHTYFAFLMKLIAAELLTLQETAFSSSLTSVFTHASNDELKAKMIDIEDGGVYSRRGITNFLEGDFFRWYLDAWESPSLKEAIKEITRALSEFEPATSTLSPASTRDLLKKLYQYLVPQEVRHRLGEYYTPDWLAELVLDKVGYDGNTLKRVLDPACGSGTFLVLAIQRAKEHGAKEKWPPLEIAKRIVANIWGFDLNPLAVIAARTNYLFALGDLVNELQHVEIPIYLTDSVLTPTKTTSNLSGEFLEVSTSVGIFQVPASWVKDSGFLINRAAPLVEELVKNQYKSEEALARFKKEGLVFPYNSWIVQKFYNQLLTLEKENKDGIWARFLKNAFAPMIADKFDFVVGNPPWIRWGYLSKEYREATLPLWKNYGLFSLKGHAARLGGGEKDFSMLFTYAAADYYLRNDAKLGFLITQEVFKSKGAGEGFRRFCLKQDPGEKDLGLFEFGETDYLKVLEAHDLVSVQPFEGAVNKTAAIILKKGNKTIYPVPYYVWKRKKGVGRILTDLTLTEALPLLEKEKLIARPIGVPTGSWQTLSSKQQGLSRIEGKNAYKARRGASTDPYGVFWIDVKQVLSEDDLLISNLAERGKQKFDFIEERVESGLVFPLLSGAEIHRWMAKPIHYVLISQDPKIRAGYSEERIRSEWPRTYGYLLKFKEELLNRALYKKYHLEEGNPFYSQYNIADYTFSNYKVVWKRMASDLVAAVVSQYKSPFGYKTIVPSDTTAFFATNDENEAYYLCAIVNSQLTREFIKSYSSAGRGFGAPSVMEHIGIPKFDPKNGLHLKLTEISKKCHPLKSEGKEIDVEKLEMENDELVKQLFKVE